MRGSSHEDLSLPGSSMHAPAQRKPSRQSQRLSSVHSARSSRSSHAATRQPDQSMDRQPDAQESTTASAQMAQSKWWHVHLFRGMINDVKRRAPYYWSDWIDAWDYRVVPATIYMYFANILPALAFSLDMFEKTNESYGVNEVLLASVLGAIVFALFAAQPLVIVGVTGMVSLIFDYEALS
ncbi:hypothetical protein N7475_005441 [Penicillium sp. IBT 31633x]|nr:hypothetical protein N7475_005441 [Penicillium sp. IBT 31633x]